MMQETHDLCLRSPDLNVLMRRYNERWKRDSVKGTMCRETCGSEAITLHRYAPYSLRYKGGTKTRMNSKQMELMCYLVVRVGCGLKL